MLDSHLPANDMTHIDATYSGIQGHLDKSTSLLSDDSRRLSCEVCSQQISPQSDIIVVCSQRHCHAVSHVNCLSQLFLSDEGRSGLVPTLGECPGCKREVTWVALMKELSMRLHGTKTAMKLLKRERKSKENTEGRKSSKTNKKAKINDDILDNDYDDLDEDWMNAVNVDFAPEPTNFRYHGESSTGRVEIVIEDSEEENFD